MWKTLMNFLPQADLLYVAMFAGLGAFCVYERIHLIDKGKAEVQAQVKATTAKAEAQRQKDLAALAASDQLKLTTIENSYAKAFADSTAANSALADRLRQFESARGSGTAMPGDPATAGEPVDPAGVTGRVDEALAGVTVAAGHDATKVIALQQYITNICLRKAP
jgi:hypothetical protein